MGKLIYIHSNTTDHLRGLIYGLSIGVKLTTLQHACVWPWSKTNIIIVCLCFRQWSKQVIMFIRERAKSWNEGLQARRRCTRMTHNKQDIPRLKPQQHHPQYTQKHTQINFYINTSEQKCFLCMLNHLFFFLKIYKKHSSTYLNITEFNLSLTTVKRITEPHKMRFYICLW